MAQQNYQKMGKKQFHEQEVLVDRNLQRGQKVYEQNLQVESSNTTGGYEIGISTGRGEENMELSLDAGELD